MVSHHSGSGSERKAVSTSTLRPPGKLQEKLLEVNLLRVHLVSSEPRAGEIHHVRFYRVSLGGSGGGERKKRKFISFFIIVITLFLYKEK